jgi:hypothetical protein
MMDVRENTNQPNARCGETPLGVASERQAEDFAWGLLVDEREAQAAWALEPWEIADYFRIPEQVGRGRIQLRLW